MLRPACDRLLHSVNALCRSLSASQDPGLFWRTFAACLRAAGQAGRATHPSAALPAPGACWLAARPARCGLWLPGLADVLCWEMRQAAQSGFLSLCRRPHATHRASARPTRDPRRRRRARTCW